MKRSPIKRRPRTAEPTRFACEICEREFDTPTCPYCLNEALPVLTGKPVARPRRPKDPIPAHVRALLAERSHGICERCSAARATDAHHVQQRSAGGGHGLENLLHLCRLCHSWAHDNVAEATRRGYLKPSWDSAP